MKYGIRLITIILLVLSSAGCSFLVSYESPYKGRIIDAETKQPIEGVVVLGVWYSESPTIAGVVGKYFDAKETVTDKQGEFELSGQGLRVFSNLSGMHVLIFKAGYKYIGMGPWESFKLDPMFKNEIAWEGNKVIVSIRKLTKEERNSSITFPSTPTGDAPLDKIRLMLKEINREATERGLDQIDIWRGERV